MKKLKIEMILDLNCSWCPIGYKYITSALKNLDLTSENIDFQFLPFQINPNMKKNGELINDNLKRKAGMNDEQLKSYRKNLIHIAKESGVEIDFNNRTHYFNTLQGHLLLHLAHEKSKQQEVYGILCNAYYKHGYQFSDDQVIDKVANSLELSAEYIVNLLVKESIKDEVSKKEHYVKSFNINSVPAFLINGTNLISGSNSVAFFENFFQETIEME